MKYLEKLLQKITNKQAKVGIMGIGYVGGAIAEAAAEYGFETLLFDIDPQKIIQINDQKKVNLTASNNWELLSQCDVICVAVQTPLYKNKTPNFNFVKNAVSTVATYLRPGQLIIIESSLSLGITRNLALPLLEASGLKPDEDFFFSFSPERIDPGNQKYRITNIPKVVSGVGKNSLKAVSQFYGQFIQQIVPVSSLEAAELTKLLENTFRFVNISFINELADYANQFNVNIKEVIAAAETKPFGFLPHYPSGGIGGYCIPVLPYFLLNGTENSKVSLSIVKAAAKVNETRPQKIIEDGLKLLDKSLLPISIGAEKSDQNSKTIYHTINLLQTVEKQNPKILLIGVAYKIGTSETRESVALKIWQLAEKMGANVSYHDPYIPTINNKTSTPLSETTLGKHDLIIITTPHKEIDYETIIKSKKPILDTTHFLN